MGVSVDKERERIVIHENQWVSWTKKILDASADDNVDYDFSWEECFLYPFKTCFGFPILLSNNFTLVKFEESQCHMPLSIHIQQVLL